MQPDPDFARQYRILVERYRLTPEAAAGQLRRILERFSRHTGEKQEASPILKQGGAVQCPQKQNAAARVP